MEIDLSWFDWRSAIAGAVPFLVLALARVFLDFNLAPYLVKWFHLIPVRTLFRDRPPKLGGKWEQLWGTDSEGFKEPTTRHSHPEIKQLGRYCYAEFYSKGVQYIVFGQIKSNHLVGHWYDPSDAQGYFGTFQLRIVNSRKMDGVWIGHSQRKAEVLGGEWNWTKL